MGIVWEITLWNMWYGVNKNWSRSQLVTRLLILFHAMRLDILRRLPCDAWGLIEHKELLLLGNEPFCIQYLIVGELPAPLRRDILSFPPHYLNVILAWWSHYLWKSEKSDIKTWSDSFWIPTLINCSENQLHVTGDKKDWTSISPVLNISPGTERAGVANHQ